MYQNRISCAYEKKVIKMKFRVSDLILKQINRKNHLKGKFAPNWEGPFVVKAVYLGNAY